MSYEIDHDGTMHTVCPGCKHRIKPGDDVVSNESSSDDYGLWHRSCYNRWYLAKCEENRPAVEARMRENLELASRHSDYEERLDDLEARAKAVGALLAGQDRTEGVIDRDGHWHDIDIEADSGLPQDDDEATLTVIERILVELEAV